MIESAIEEYFRSDFRHAISSILEIELKDNSESVVRVKVRPILDFDSGTSFLAVLFVDSIPCESDIVALCRNAAWLIHGEGFREVLLPRAVPDGKQFYVRNGESNRLIIKYRPTESYGLETAESLAFSGKMYCYCREKLADELQESLIKKALSHDVRLEFRDSEYATMRYDLHRPLGFLSHDSRDKPMLATPLADALIARSCTVWFDSYSLPLGANLRESIEEGLRTCYRVILLVTPNFLNNPGWTKREFEAVFTRELLEDSNLFIPIWSGVSQKEVYDYSPTLANRVALIWSGNVEALADRIARQLRELHPYAEFLSRSNRVD